MNMIVDGTKPACLTSALVNAHPSTKFVTFEPHHGGASTQLYLAIRATESLPQTAMPSGGITGAAP
jgi:hypothetical protein